MYICSQHGETFKYAESLEKHKVTHKRKKPYACKHFGNILSWFGCYNIHECSHIALCMQALWKNPQFQFI